MKTTIPNARRAKAQFKYNQFQVCWLTGMSEEEYNTLMYETAVRWLEMYLGDTADITNLLKEPIIWGWWQSQWNLRDEGGNLSRLYEPPLFFTKDELKGQYKDLHRFCCIPTTPGYDELVDSYCVAVGLLGKKKLKKSRR